MILTTSLVFMYLASPFLGGWTWLPGDTIHPRALADPREPALALTAESERLDTAIGVPIPLAGWGETEMYRITLEAGYFAVLGRDDAFFPMRTVDGVITLAGEAQECRWHGKLRLTHISSHQADGDSTVSYRGKTSSREFGNVELGYKWDTGLFVYGRLGASWHAVPEDNGPQAAIGANYVPRPHSTGIVAAVHLDSDAQSNWRVDQSLFLGIGVGNSTRVRAGLRYYNGNSPVGQYRHIPLQTLGFELQFSPW